MNIAAFEKNYMGRRVRFSARLDRACDSLGTGRYGRAQRMTWHVVHGPIGEGWVVGVRWRFDGVRQYDSEYGWTFAPSGKTTPVALVACGARKKPIDVPIDALTVLPTKTERHNL